MSSVYYICCWKVQTHLGFEMRSQSASLCFQQDVCLLAHLSLKLIICLIFFSSLLHVNCMFSLSIINKFFCLLLSILLKSLMSALMLHIRTNLFNCCKIFTLKISCINDEILSSFTNYFLLTYIHLKII